MSLFHPVNLVCPKCEAPVVMMAVGSVNADRRPDLRDDILANHFQDIECTACQERFRLQPQFNFLDVGRGQWIAAMPSDQLRNHLQVEDDALTLFDDSYGANAPKAAQEVGNGLQMRVTFGWPAVREKLLIRQHDLDDVIIEMMKLHILRSVPSVPMAEGVELRLVDIDEDSDSHIFSWLETATEKAIEGFRAPADLYRAIHDNPTAWDAMRQHLVNGSFVDMQKLYMGAGRQSA